MSTSDVYRDVEQDRTSRAKILFRPRCKNTLEQETKFRQNPMQPEVETGSNGVRYSRLKALLPRYCKKSFNYDLCLQENKRELERIKLEMEKIEDDLQNDQRLSLNHRCNETNSPTKSLSSHSISPSTITWQEKLRNFMYDLSEALKLKVNSQKYEEYPETKPANSVGIIELSNEEIMVCSEDVKDHQQDFIPQHSGEIKLSNILEEDHTSLTHLESISLSTTSSKLSIENEQMISKVFSTFLRNSKAFLRSKYHYKKKITVRMSENESDEESVIPQKPSEKLEEATSNVTKELDTNRALLGLEPIIPDILESICLRKRTSEIDLVCKNLDYAQPSTSKIEEAKYEEDKIQNQKEGFLEHIQENHIVDYATKTFQKFWKRKYRRNSLGQVLKEEIELKELKQETKEEEKLIQNIDGKEVQNLSQINGFKGTSYFKKVTPTSTLKRCKTSLVKENEIMAEKHESVENQNAGDPLGELIDILQVMKETCDEMREIKEGLTFHKVKSDRSIKPLKVHRDYRAPIEESKRRQPKRKGLENPDGDGLESERTNVIETIAIIHKPPD